MRQALILAGGEATRMRPLTDDRPKAMVEVAGFPIVEHQLRWLADHGVSHAVLSVGYRADAIEAHVGDGDVFGIDVAYAVEAESLGRGGALKFASGLLPFADEGWLGLNGDVICRFPLKQLVEEHRALRPEGVLVTVALAPYRSNWGVAELDGKLIRGFLQSPRLPYWINAGVYAIEPEITSLLPDKGDHEESTFPQLAAAGQMAGFLIDGYWRGIDTAKDATEATAELLARD